MIESKDLSQFEKGFNEALLQTEDLIANGNQDFVKIYYHETDVYDVYDLICKFGLKPILEQWENYKRNLEIEIGDEVQFISGNCGIVFAKDKKQVELIMKNHEFGQLVELKDIKKIGHNEEAATLIKKLRK